MKLKLLPFLLTTVMTSHLWARSEPLLQFLDVKGDIHQISATESSGEEFFLPPIHYMHVERNGQVTVSFRMAHCRGIVHNSLFNLQTRLEGGRLYLAFGIDTQGVLRGRGARPVCEAQEREQALSQRTFMQDSQKESLRTLVRQAEEIIVVNEVNPNSMVQMYVEN